MTSDGDLSNQKNEIIQTGVSDMGLALNNEFLITVASIDNNSIFKTEISSNSKTLLYNAGGSPISIVTKNDKVIFATSSSIKLLNLNENSISTIIDLKNSNSIGDADYIPTLIYTSGSSGVIAQIRSTDYNSSHNVDIWSIGFTGDKQYLTTEKFNQL